MDTFLPDSSEPAGLVDRRTVILAAAGRVLLRFGFRKASVDEVAREARVSRQGVYLYFATKDALFAAAVEYLLQTTVASARAALNTPDVALEQRIVTAFKVMAGPELTDRLAEVLDTAERLTGRSAVSLEGEIIAEFADTLERSPASSFWRRGGDSASEVAELLYALSDGMKRRAPTVAEYLAAMDRAVRLICTTETSEAAPP
jgi:AcrR family transcriptional regulator